MNDAVELFMRPGDQMCAEVEQFLQEREIPFRSRDVLQDPGATAVLYGRLGTVTVPVVIKGAQMVVGYDPIQLAKLFPRVDPNTITAVTLGAAMRTVTGEIAEQLHLRTPFGVELGPVKEGSAAADAELHPHDVITAIGSYTITGGVEQFAQALTVRRPGDSMEITFVRDGVSSTRTITFPKMAEETSMLPDGEHTPAAEDAAVDRDQ